MTNALVMQAVFTNKYIPYCLSFSNALSCMTLIGFCQYRAFESILQLSPQSWLFRELKLGSSLAFSKEYLKMYTFIFEEMYLFFKKIWRNSCSEWETCYCVQEKGVLQIHILSSKWPNSAGDQLLVYPGNPAQLELPDNTEPWLFNIRDFDQANK